MQPAIEFGRGRHQPFTGRCEDQGSGLFRFNECSGDDGRHEVQGFRVRLSAAERGLSNYKKSGYAATTSVSIAATGSSRTTRMDLKQHIRSIPDFPKPGILFYDISTLLAHPKAWQTTVHRLAEALRPHQPDLLVGIESRGFLVAAPLAYQLGRGFAMVRKQGKLPGRTVRFTYDLEYGTDTIEIQEDAISPGPAGRRARRSAGDRGDDAGRHQPRASARRRGDRRGLHYRAVVLERAEPDRRAVHVDGRLR